MSASNKATKKTLKKSGKQKEKKVIFNVLSALRSNKSEINVTDQFL